MAKRKTIALCIFIQGYVIDCLQDAGLPRPSTLETSCSGHQGYFHCTGDFHFPGYMLYFRCSPNTISSLFKYNTYMGQHGMNKVKKTNPRILPMKVSRPSIFVTARGQDDPCCSVAICFLHEQGFFLCF